MIAQRWCCGTPDNIPHKTTCPARTVRTARTLLDAEPDPTSDEGEE